MAGVSGKYRLDQRLGGGGMAEVFLASTMGAEGFSRKVAIKRVLPGYSDNESFAKMFVSEARISSQLVHPNIVSTLDFDRDPEGRLFLVMELIEGKDLDALMGTGLLPFDVVIFVIAEVLRGLGYAHDLPVHSDARGIVHRDISPHNVLLSWAGAVKVSDFGIAKARAASEATASVFIKGKPAYMSPEQANGQPLDGRSDLFAVGIMLWEMLVGRRLFTGEDTRATLAAVLFGQIPRPRSLRADVPKDLERVTMKLLERDLPARYPTAEHALHELLECADSPKAGREALIAALSERFQGEAPVRHSLLRQRQGSANPYAGTTPTPVPGSADLDTQRGLAGRPAAAVPSLGAMRNAPTGTLDVGPRRHGRRIALVLVVTVGSALATFGIVSAIKGRRSDAGSPAIDAVSAVAPTGSDAADLDPPPDAPIDAPIDASIPADAAPVDAMIADAAVKKAAPRLEKKYGSLKVTSAVGSQVTIIIDGKPYADTPNTIPRVLVGRRQLTLVNNDADIRVTDHVFIRENQTTVYKLTRKK